MEDVEWQVQVSEREGGFGLFGLAVSRKQVEAQGKVGCKGENIQSCCRDEPGEVNHYSLQRK